MTLREIADELGINYRTVIGCKNRYEQYLRCLQVGRNARYEADMTDFFRLVFALQDEGYSTERIIQLLTKGAVSDDDQFIKEWLDEWRQN